VKKSVLLFLKTSIKTEGSNQPDYRIYFDNGPKNNMEVPASNTNDAKGTQAPKAEAKTDVKSEEIPF
jgi:hypothetical protein